jgi:hypothetical protein
VLAGTAGKNREVLVDRHRRGNGVRLAIRNSVHDAVDEIDHADVGHELAAPGIELHELAAAHRDQNPRSLWW